MERRERRLYRQGDNGEKQALRKSEKLSHHPFALCLVSICLGNTQFIAIKKAVVLCNFLRLLLPLPHFFTKRFEHNFLLGSMYQASSSANLIVCSGHTSCNIESA